MLLWGIILIGHRDRADDIQLLHVDILIRLGGHLLGPWMRPFSCLVPDEYGLDWVKKCMKCKSLERYFRKMLI